MSTAAAIDLIIHHRIGLERYSASLNRRIAKILNKAEADIIAKLATMPAVETGTLGPSAATRYQLELRLQQIRATLAEAFGVITSTVETELGDLATHEVDFLAKTYKATMPMAQNFVAPSPQLLKAIVTSRPMQGRFIKDWLASYPDTIRRKVHESVMLGIVEGESTAQIVSRIRGTRALAYGDAVLKGTKRGVEALVRTAVNHVTNTAHKAFLDENSDIIDRYIWISVLDGATTPVCRSRAGRVYTVGGSNPIPPSHVNCRSSISGILIGEEVEPVNNYAEWLGRQSKAAQVDTLGPARHRLWMDGRVTLDKFVDASGQTLTLDQLKARDAKAWSAAFGNKAPREAAIDPGKARNDTPPVTPQKVAASKPVPEPDKPLDIMTLR